MGMGNSLNFILDEAERFRGLGHSNWTIYSPLSQFYIEPIPSFSPLYWKVNSYYPRGLKMGKGNSHNFKFGWDWGVSVPWAFQLDNWQSYLSQLYSEKFSSFSPLYWEANSYYPRGLKMGKGIHPTSKLNETRGFQCLGHWNWTICNPLSSFCS